MPELKAVKSSAIAAIGHDAETNTLHVRFHSGGTYQYPDVSAAEHAAFANAPSIGRHFAQHILSKGQSRRTRRA
jgi:hypothetical protein